MKNRFINIIVLAILLVLPLSACSNDKTAEKNKDELVLAFGSEPANGWDPIKGSGHYGTALFQSALLKRDVDLHIQKDLAKDYSLSDDKKTYTVDLREDVKFSDGSNLTAKDVVFTYEKAKNEPNSAVDLSRLKSVKADGDYRVIFTLEKPDIGFLSKMVSLSIVPKDLYNEDYGQNPIGSGPLKFVEWKKGQQLITEPNPYYYGDKIPFKKITFLFMDPKQATTSAKAKIADVIRIPVTEANTKFDGYRLVTLETIDNRGISFPFVKRTGQKTGDKSIAKNAVIGNDITSDIAVRKAFNIAIDRQKLIDGALLGHGTKASSLCDMMPWYNQETKVVKDGDINQANKILDDAGWKMGKDNIREKNGLKAKLNLYYAYKDRENIALFFAQTAKQIGFEITPVYAQWSEIEPKMYSELVLFGWGGYDPLEIYYNYSSNMRGIDYYNSNFYSNKKVDSYFEKALSSSSEKEAYEYFKKAQWDGETGLSSLGDCPWVWLVNENHLYLVRDGLDIGKQKIQPHGGGWPLVDTISNWKWDK